MVSADEGARTQRTDEKQLVRDVALGSGIEETFDQTPGLSSFHIAGHPAQRGATGACKGPLHPADVVLAKRALMRLLNHEIEAQLPCMRRHARAMSGNRELGDSIAMHAMVSFLHDDRFFYEGSALKVVLFRALQDARI